MSDEPLYERVSIHPVGAVSRVASLLVVAGAGVLGVVLVSGLLSLAGPVAGFGIGAASGLLVVLARARGGAALFYRDHLTRVGGPALARSVTLPYTEVALAVERSTLAGRILGTTTVDLVTGDGTTVTLPSLGSPRRVRRLLAQQVPPVAERATGADDTALAHLVDSMDGDAVVLDHPEVAERFGVDPETFDVGALGGIEGVGSLEAVDPTDFGADPENEAEPPEARDERSGSESEADDARDSEGERGDTDGSDAEDRDSGPEAGQRSDRIRTTDAPGDGLTGGAVENHDGAPGRDDR